MPVKPPGKSNLGCQDCGHTLTILEAAIFTLKPKGKGCCPKCKKANVVLVVY